MDRQIDFESMSNDELFREYKATGDQRVKQELTLRYVPLIRRVAVQLHNVYAGFSQVDDIVDEGVITVMSALDKFEPEKNVKFESYISKRLRGMVIDIARKQDWIPRSTRKIAKDIDRVTGELYERLGRPPTDDELAEGLHISKKKYYEELRKIDLFNVISLDVVMDETCERQNPGMVPEGDNRMIPEQKYLEQEQKKYLQDGIMGLRENERLVVSLYYEQELSIKKIAQILMVSEPRVSQIHGNALKKLKKYMEAF